MINNTLTLALICLSFCLSFGQEINPNGGPTINSIVFSYDDSGNQIKREFTIASDPLTGKESPEDNPLSEQLSGKIFIYPNPTRGLFYIEWENEITQQVIMVEVLSTNAVVQTHRINSSVNQLQVDITSGRSGIYFVQFTFIDGSMLSQKIIKL